MAISSHRNEASLRNYIDHPTNEQLKACSDILFNALSGRPHQSLQLSSTALSCRAIVMFLWIRQSFIHKTHALSSSFSKLSCEKICVFFLSRILLNISPPDSVLETEKNSGKRVKFDSALFCCDDKPRYDGPQHDHSRSHTVMISMNFNSYASLAISFMNLN